MPPHDETFRRITPDDYAPLATRRAVPTTPAADPPAPAAPVCPVCDGIGYYKTPVPIAHPDFGVLFPCDCTRDERARRAAADLLARSNLALFRDKRFETFRRLTPGVREAYCRAQAFADDPQGWLVLLGGYGTGKTHLAAAIANALLDRGVALYFAIAPDLLDHLRAAFRPESAVTYDELFERVKTVAVLILDDLGTENATPWAKEKLFQLLNHRYAARLPTVVTSNRTLDDLDGRIASRLADTALGEPIQMDAGDYRRQRDAGAGHAD